MLVIRRRAGESLLIADNIEIEILELGPAHVKLGIRAPREVIILRKEVELTRAQNRNAASILLDQKLAGVLQALPSLRTNMPSCDPPPAR